MPCCDFSTLSFHVEFRGIAVEFPLSTRPYKGVEMENLFHHRGRKRYTPQERKMNK